MKIFLYFTVILVLIAPLFGLAHPGRTASDGCHYCRTNCSSYGEEYNERHCHGGESSYVYDDSYTSGSRSNSASSNNSSDNSWMLWLGGASFLGYAVWEGKRKRFRKHEHTASTPKAEPDENIKCPRCNSSMLLKKGRFGSFYGCSRYPRCRGTKKSEKT